MSQYQHNQSQLGIGCLPDEIWLKILGYLIMKEPRYTGHNFHTQCNILKLATVSKKLNCLIREASLYRDAIK